MNRIQICRILFLFTLCGMLIDGMLAQSIADVARQEREKRKEREQKQQEQEKKHPLKTHSTPKVSRNENAPPEGELNNAIPSPSSSPTVPLEALPSASPSASPERSASGSSVMVIFLILGYGLIIAGGLWMLIVTFRTSVWWGLGCLFIPFVELVYLVKYWKEARGPCGVQCLGFFLLVIALQIGS